MRDSESHQSIKNQQCSNKKFASNTNGCHSHMGSIIRLLITNRMHCSLFSGCWMSCPHPDRRSNLGSVNGVPIVVPRTGVQKINCTNSVERTYINTKQAFQSAKCVNSTPCSTLEISVKSRISDRLQTLSVSLFVLLPNTWHILIRTDLPCQYDEPNLNALMKYCFVLF